MSFHAHFLYTDGMREYFVQIVPDVPEILSQSRRLPLLQVVSNRKWMKKRKKCYGFK